MQFSHIPSTHLWDHPLPRLSHLLLICLRSTKGQEKPHYFHGIGTSHNKEAVGLTACSHWQLSGGQPKWDHLLKFAALYLMLPLYHMLITRLPQFWITIKKNGILSNEENQRPHWKFQHIIILTNQKTGPCRLSHVCV